MTTKVRRHERVSLVAGIAIQADKEQPGRFAGTVINISLGGVGIFSPYYFAPETCVVLELTVPVPGEGLRRVTLHGVTRWTQVQADGNFAGIELLTNPKAGDYAWFSNNFDQCICARGRRVVTRRPRTKCGLPSAEDN